MKKNFILHSLTGIIAGVSAILICSCNSDSKESILPEIHIDTSTTYTFSCDGGNINIPVQLNNPDENTEFSFQCDCDWISAEYYEPEIIITAESLEGYEERTGEIHVTYGEFYEGVITVLQYPETYPSYSIKVKDISATTATIDIQPAREELQYMIRPIRKDVFDSYKDEDEFFKAESEYIEYMETQESTPLGQMLHNGTLTDIELLYLDTDTEYYICAYAINENGDILSSVSKSEVFKTDEIHFDITTSVDGINITVNVTASDDKAPFIFDIVNAQALQESGKDVEDVAQEVIDLNLWTAETFFKNNTIQAIPTFTNLKTAEHSFSRYNIGDHSYDNEASSKFIVYATTVNQYGKVGTIPSDTTSTYTEAINASDNEITVTIDNITSTGWDLTVTTTNNDPYVTYFDYADKYEGWTKEELIAEFSNTEKYDYLFYTHNGNYKTTYGMQDPDTNFVMFVFGWEGGTMTTDFQAHYYRTLPE